MSKHIVFKCDRCEREIREPDYDDGIMLVTDKYGVDAAGGYGPAYEDVERLDLCSRCTRFYLRTFLEGYSNAQRREFVRKILERGKP